MKMNATKKAIAISQVKRRYEWLQNAKSYTVIGKIIPKY